MALSVRIVREFFPEAGVEEVAACSGFTSFLPGTGPGSGGFSARTFFGVSNSSTGAAGSASFGFSSVGSGEDAINGFTRLAKFRRARARAELTVDREDDAASGAWTGGADWPSLTTSGRERKVAKARG